MNWAIPTASSPKNAGFARVSVTSKDCDCRFANNDVPKENLWPNNRSFRKAIIIWSPSAIFKRVVIVRMVV